MFRDPEDDDIFNDLIIHDIDEDSMTELEKEILHDEMMEEDDE